MASSATTKEVVEVLVEKFRPDMRMLTPNRYNLFEVHINGGKFWAGFKGPGAIFIKNDIIKIHWIFLLKNRKGHTIMKKCIMIMQIFVVGMMEISQIMGMSSI